MTLTPLLWMIFKNAWYYPVVTVLELIGCGTMLYLAHKFSFKDRFCALQKTCTSPRNLLHYLWYTSAYFVAMAQFIYRARASRTAQLFG